MGRPKTASNILDARGAFKKNPDRARPDEPKPEGEFPKQPPVLFSKLETEIWYEIVALVPGGVLTSADAPIVEIIAVLFAEFRTKGARMPTAQLTRMCSLMGRIGLDPAGRAGLVVNPGDGPRGTGFDDL